ncbi:DUF742 domain-containing protein [Streptomyces sp. NP-1717]|uniref:DUF742 domain-containing protein n=1 Tax=unclassified Streptomyces TaxID=2593676 RepID=UPI001F5C95F3|nr:DUF742 domain-containing protein [Streptomyces sp. NP-1717]MCI3224560.1 DUF742 domain-containing protein [Streptomyces sp. NP-1717]WTA76489.1 DUF742 domain-containing protein [Streptomyces sp. NBC_00838]
MSRGQHQRRLLPAYLATGGGGGAPLPTTLDTLTALRASGHPFSSYHTTVHRRVVELVTDGSLTAVEIAAYLALPASVGLMLAEQLVSDGLLNASVPIPEALAPSRAGRPSMQLMEEVLSGLQSLRVA